MSEPKIAFLGNNVSVPALLASVAEREGLDAVVMVCRVNGCWETCWSNDIDYGGLSMAALKLLTAAEDAMHGRPSTWSPPEKDAV
jgi:hypothetical protein